MIYKYDSFDNIYISRAKNKCEQTENIQVQPNTDESLFCPRTFDGWSCWNETPAGQVATVSCPHFITGFDPQRLAYKVCENNGVWFRHPSTNQTWSNYTTCIDMEDLEIKQTLNKINVIGYSVSLVALFISLILFCIFRSLNCIRITIHKNLFVSFIINNGIWIIWYTVMEIPQVTWANEVGCQVLHVVLQYFLVCNYFWMFCEGLYLHTILVIAFVDKESIMDKLYIIGWGIPAILIIIYATVRNSYPSETVHCWINESPYCWIIKAPVYISMVANLIFLINIVKVLVTKLRAVNSSDTDQTIKAVRATIILIPLLGLHYFITPFRPEPKSSLEFIYGVVSAIATSFQGFAVALLFCFCNAEILFLIQKEWWIRKSIRGRTSSFMTSLSVGNISHSVFTCENKPEVLPNSSNDSWRTNSARRPSQLTKNGGKTKGNKHICLENITPPPRKSRHSTSRRKELTINHTHSWTSPLKIGGPHKGNKINETITTFMGNPDDGELL